MTGAEILDRLSAKGVYVWPAGDKLRFAPRSAVDDDLLGAMRQHKAEILAVLAPAESSAPSILHELSFTERIESGYVNPGWTATSWARRLRQLANACDALRPDRAGDLRRWAHNVEGRGGKELT